MLAGLNSKIIGSLLVGVALVAGAFTMSRFGEPRMAAPAAVIESQAPARVAITITDKDQNGVEDWRDQLVPAQLAAIIPSASSSYELPTTLTGRMSIGLIESYAQAKNNGPFGSTQAEIVSETVDFLTEETAQSLYGVKDITVIEAWTDEDIKNYANVMAGAIINNKVSGVDHEVTIMYEALVRGNTDRMKELPQIIAMYKSTLDDSLPVPVPRLFLKQHLDLVNSYSALRQDTEAMSQVFEDPAVTLLRFKRYRDDVTGLRLSLQNMQAALVPYERLFTPNDPAVLFAQFSLKQNGIY